MSGATLDGMTKQRSIAQRLFDSSRAEGDLEEQLIDAGVEFSRLGWDWYDCSLEIHGVPAGLRLSAAAQGVVHAAGFAKVYVNHEDGWETHYSFRAPEFAEAKGWRVSYPHRRNDGNKSIWVEEFIAGWPKEWFDTGYVVIKAPV